MKKIAIIGAGGRTGAMFAFELNKVAKILGVCKEKEFEKIKEKKLYIKRGKEPPKLLEINVIEEKEFPGEFLPDIIFLTTKNPVGPVVEYYFQKLKEEKKLPALILSQNGLSAGKEAKEVLERILGEKGKEVEIIRVSLLTPVVKECKEDKIYISYSLPLKLCFALFSGKKSEIETLFLLFKKSKIKVQQIPPEKVKDMEFSKLFLNLIGIPSASKNLSLKEGFNNKETFKEEINSLREYIKIVKAQGGSFLNFSFYPVKLFAFLIERIPLPILIFFRKIICQIIQKARNEKEKGNLDEIDYYNGEILKLGKKLGIETPINEEILKRAKKLAGCQSG